MCAPGGAHGDAQLVDEFALTHIVLVQGLRTHIHLLFPVAPAFLSGHDALSSGVVGHGLWLVPHSGWSWR